jgi:hypothetical protein
MRSLIARFALLFVAVACAACYQSPVPPAGPNLALDSSLLGTWEEIDPEGSPTIVTIRPDSVATYTIEIPWRRGSTDNVSRAQADITNIGDSEFATVHDSEEPGFLVLKLNRNRDGTIALSTLTDNLPKFTQPEQLRAYLAQHANDADIVQDVLRLRRVSSR